MSGWRVLIIVQNLPVPFDRRVWLEALALQQAGYQVSIICPMGQHGDFQQRRDILDEIAIYRYPAPPDARHILAYVYEFIYCWLWTAWLSLRVWRERGFDIIQACNPPETYFLLAWFYKRLGRRFIFDHHDLSPEMYLAKGKRTGGLLYRGLLLLEWLTFKTADVLITTNESHRQVAIARGGCAPEQIFIVRSGPDTARLRLLPPEAELKQGFRYLACYLGEMCEQDGVDYLLRAIQQIVQGAGRQDCLFVLMGGGPEGPALRQLCTELGLDTWVRFTGRVSDVDLCRYLSTADLCIDPDPWTQWSDQSTMNKIMEYMFFGKAIAAFDLKENRYSAGEAAAYARINDEEALATLICDLLDDAPRRAHMGAVGQQRIHDELNWSYSIPNLLAAYEKARLRPGPRPPE